MEFINTFLSFLTDGSKKLTHRALTAIFLLLGVLLIDNLFGFSFYYNVDKKVTLVQNIDSTIKDSTLAPKDKLKLMELRTTIITHRSIKDYFWDYVMVPYWKDEKTTSNQQPIQPEFKQGRNSFWHFITAGSVWILLMIIAPFILFAERGQSILQRILTIISIEIIFYLLSLGQARIFFYMPIIFGKIWINYLVHLVVNAGILALIAKMGNSSR